MSEIRRDLPDEPRDGGDREPDQENLDRLGLFPERRIVEGTVEQTDTPQSPDKLTFDGGIGVTYNAEYDRFVIQRDGDNADSSDGVGRIVLEKPLTEAEREAQRLERREEPRLHVFAPSKEVVRAIDAPGWRPTGKEEAFDVKLDKVFGRYRDPEERRRKAQEMVGNWRDCLVHSEPFVLRTKGGADNYVHEVLEPLRESMHPSYMQGVTLIAENGNVVITHDEFGEMHREVKNPLPQAIKNGVHDIVEKYEGMDLVRGLETMVHIIAREGASRRSLRNLRSELRKASFLRVSPWRVLTDKISTVIEHQEAGDELEQRQFTRWLVERGKRWFSQ